MLFPGMAPARKAELIEWYTISTKYIIMISRMYKAPFTSVISFSPTTTLWNWCLILPIQIRKCKYLDQGYMDNVGHLIPGLIDTRAPVLNHSAISFLFFQSRPGQKSEWPPPLSCPSPPHSIGCNCLVLVSRLFGGGCFWPQPTLTFCWIWVLAWQFLLSFPLALWES